MEAIERLRRLTGHGRINSVFVDLVLCNLIERRSDKLRSDVIVHISLEALELRKQRGFQDNQKRRGDVGVSDHITPCGLQRKTDAVDVTDDGLFVEVDIISRSGCKLSPADHDTLFVLPYTPETVSSKSLELAGCESMFLRGRNSSHRNIAERSVRIRPGAHTCKSRSHTVVGNNLAFVHRPVCEHNGATLIGDGLIVHKVLHDLCVVGHLVEHIGDIVLFDVGCLISGNVDLVLAIGACNRV